MLQFLQPIWLLGMAGISVPLLIHLWNHRQGRVLLVGSVALFRETPRKSARSLHFSEWWLLLLRCLLIILLALLLAGPVWKTSSRAAAKRGWVLVSRPSANDFTREIDSLVQAGFALHYFEKDFPVVRVKDLQATDTGRPNYWATLALLQQAVSPAQPVYIFTDRLQRHFSGERPRVQLDLHWQTTLPGAGHNPPPAPDTALQHFTIWAGAHPEDAQYIQAALLAIREFGGRQMEIHVASNTAALPARQDWLFWLSEAPLPGTIQAGHVLQYVPGNAQSERSWLQPGHTDISIHQRVPAPEQAALWRDGFGYPLLTQQGTHYYAYTHFNTSWNDLPWSPRLPALLLQLIYPGGYSDRRAMPAQALQPVQVAGLAQTISPPVKELRNAGWLLLLLLFVGERLASGLLLKQKEENIE